jgi:thiamine kinase-like enzyme
MRLDPLLPIIQKLLEDTFQMTKWEITRASEGQQKDCYVARSPHHATFVKFDGDAPIAALRRLGELGVAPRLIGYGNTAGRAYTVHQYVVGSHPNWRWFADHLPLLAHVTRRYHEDTELRRLLTAKPSQTYGDHLAADLAQLSSQLSAALARPTAPAESEVMRGLFTELQAQAPLHSAVSLAPIHPDPNGANIFIHDDGTITLVDWDTIQLSDPLRDVSQWLGWYVPAERWPIFFAEYGLPLDDATRPRVYWWSARASFANVLWHLEHSYEYEVFLRDTRAALDHATTPHQVFREDT